MAFVDLRLTLFALLSSIEQDMRSHVLEHLAPQLVPNALLGVFFDKCMQRFVIDDAGDPAAAGTTTLLPYTDLGDLHQILNTHATHLPAPIATFFRSRTSLFETLVPIRNRVMHIRPLSFDDIPTTLAAATSLAADSTLSWTHVRTTLDRLNHEPHFVLGLSIPMYDQGIKRHNLPSPDFDETGFLGRQTELEHLNKLSRGPYPVITLLGVGGIGKSALAVKLSYDLLDAPDRPFDAVVWASSKTTQLTATDIRTVRDAITDSVGLIGSIAQHLSGNASSDPFQEVLDYLESFKILVVLDNLETVLDDRIRSFLARLPQGSKVLITSRIGVGAYEFPLRLNPLSKGESIQLLRAVAKSRGLQSLVAMSNKDLEVYCTRLMHNPGFIKWFVSAVHSGVRPEDVLANPDTFLDFCMSNVYDYLSDPSRAVLRSMLVSQDRQNQAELAFITDFQPLELQQALQELLAANMIGAHSVARAKSYDTRYEVNDLTRAYLNKHYPVAQQEFERVNGRLRQLIRLRESSASGARDPYSIYCICTRSPGDLVVARYLSDALEAVRSRDYVRADQLIARARELSPDFSEVHRVQAWNDVQQGHFASAQSSYEAAIELNPESGPLRLWYGGFLLRVDKTDEALRQFTAGIDIDPGAVPIQIEIARCKVYLRQFDEALKVLTPLVEDEPSRELGERVLRKVWDLTLQAHRRMGDVSLDRQDNYAALNAFVAFRERFDRCPVWLRDDRMWEQVRSVESMASILGRKPIDEELRNRVEEIVQWCGTALNLRAEQQSRVKGAMSGVVRQISHDKNFGFIRVEDGGDVFFHRSGLENQSLWKCVVADTRVRFRVVDGEKGPCAVGIQVEADDIGEAKQLSGVVSRVFVDSNYGFLVDERGRELFFHRKGMRYRDQWSRVERGSRVTFSMSQNAKGPVADDVRLA